MGTIEANKLVGKCFEELSNEEMENLQGSGDVTPYSTPGCAMLLSAVWATITKC
ncbi:type 2 lantibiotic [Bacillus thuringiensis]|uniref:lichenicidin A2 family type 2 lantibiotic n=1 Tax=Bacillus cereus group TaxID=86661 RepID=UPI00099D5ED1|nr:lichenicidin A2 family type 2 lantibiotic [Bacillus thuringiensis]PFB87242.1 type 2 lantibiotic [Bacillus thuringiensis]PFJ58569.1 type 2 lantibiotic [Bacillus thuringiensis]